MRLTVVAVGRQRSGPEADLVTDYLTRAERTGRALGLAPVRLVEVEDKRKGGQAAEAALLAKAVPEGARLVALDERGRVMASPRFAATLGEWRDTGAGETAFVIGGADGLTEEMRTRADLILSFGKMVWPHLLARAMLAEQIYRATAILAGTPYHRV